jgi:hypothetical protein
MSMTHRFRHHFTPAEATALIPDLARWLEELRPLTERVNRQAVRIQERLSDLGDQGGQRVNNQTRDQVRLQTLLGEFIQRGIRIRDLERGQVDFPALRGDREIFLTWQEGETSVIAWREIPN